MKPTIVQRSSSDPIPVQQLARVDYPALLQSLRFPVTWVYEDLLQGWLPYESFTDLSEPSQRWEPLKESWNQDGFVIVRGLLSRDFCAQAADYFYRQPAKIERWHDMEGIKRASMNNSPLMRLVHQTTEPMARYLLGDIKTSYSFTASYETGTILPRHTDRPQCKFNASIMLGSDPAGADLRQWPLFIDVGGKVSAIKLDAGDGVFYTGTKDPHWREVLPSSLSTVLGTFFHYVPSDFTGSLN